MGQEPRADADFLLSPCSSLLRTKPTAVVRFAASCAIFSRLLPSLPDTPRPFLPFSSRLCLFLLAIQFYCNCLSMSQIIDRQSILFYKRILSSSNVILCTLLRFKQSDICDLLAKYRIPSIVITSTRSKAIDDCWAFGVLGGALTLSSTCVVFLDVS